jgi:hypothetical protein
MTLCFIILIVGHTVADFFFQTDKQATNKSSSNAALFEHVCTYSGVLFSFAWIACFLFLLNAPELILPIDSFSQYVAYSFLLAICFTLVNGACHFITDYITSRLTTYFYKQDKRHEFFCVIGVDQAAHMITLIGSFSLIMASVVV